jgi:hypothetical protein
VRRLTPSQGRAAKTIPSQNRQRRTKNIGQPRGKDRLDFPQTNLKAIEQAPVKRLTPIVWRALTIDSPRQARKTFSFSKHVPHCLATATFSSCFAN